MFTLFLCGIGEGAGDLYFCLVREIGITDIVYVLNKKIERVSKCDLGYPKKRNKNKFGKVNLITYLCIGFKNKKSYENKSTKS